MTQAFDKIDHSGNASIHVIHTIPTGQACRNKTWPHAYDGHVTILFLPLASECDYYLIGRLLSIGENIKSECIKAGTPKEPQVNYSVWAGLTENDDETNTRVQTAFDDFFGSSSVPMKFTRACEDSPPAQGRNIPYTYWNFGGSTKTGGEIPTNHSPVFAPAIQPTLEAGVSAMALAALTISAS
ncbi:amidohydrolase [Paraphaeosphaeria sporulosa]